MLVITTDLRTDGGTQPRGRLDDDVVERYTAEMETGLWEFSKSSAPITAFHDGENYWLGDGFHRVAAAKKARLDEVEVDVRQGGQREAILYSAGANATHGFPRSNEDKRRAVSRLLDDPEWSKWSDREIARRCSVAHPFVSKLRASLETVTSERTYTTKHGAIATMDTSRIGRSPQCAAEPAGEPAMMVTRNATQVADSDRGYCAYMAIKGYLDHKRRERPPLPAQSAIRGMTEKQRAAVRRAAEQSRDWIDGLLKRLDRDEGDST